MKKLLTLLLLVISLLASGQSDSQSLEVEISYWKSIAESNDTVAYRQYLDRYGETGLYYDEAITRITLLKTSGKQAKSNSAECFFYKRKKNSDYVVYVVVFFNENEMDFISTTYHVIRENLAKSQDYYENYFMKRKYSELAYKYDQMKSTSSRNVYFARDIRIFKEWYGPRDGIYSSAPPGGHNGHWVEKKIYGYRYYAISKDKSSIITWFEDDNNLDGVIQEKNEYYRIPKEELLPKAVNYDFLNE